MENELLKICGIAILCVALLLISRELKGSFLWAIRVVGIILIMGVLTLNIDGAGQELTLLTASGGISEYAAVMLKALGISLLVKICADICRDCGEGSLAFGVESAGKVSIIYMCIPLISDIMRYAAEILDFGDV